MEAFTNSAMRLHELLLEMKKESRDERLIREVLGKVFEVESSDDSAIWRKIILLDDLFIQVERLITAIPNIGHDRYTRYFPSARKNLVSIALDQDSKRFVPFQSALTDVVLQSIEFCGLRILESVHEVQIPANDLSELEVRLSELFDFINDADLEPELREVSLDIVEVLRSAIADYRIRGVAGLEDAIERSVGKLSLYHLRAKKNGKPSNEAHLGKILDLIIKFETVVSKAHVYLPVLIDLLPKLLGS